LRSSHFLFGWAEHQKVTKKKLRLLQSMKSVDCTPHAHCRE
jgi:hypothetical protein